MKDQEIPRRQANWAEEVEQDIASEEAFRKWQDPISAEATIGYGKAIIKAEQASERSLVPVTEISETAVIPVVKKEVSKAG